MPRIAAPVTFALALSLLPPSARAQVVDVAPPPPAVNQEGMRDFCIYANQLYSLGAQLCVPGSNTGIRCVASEGTKSSGRALWSYDSKDWPITPDLRCGGGR